MNASDRPNTCKSRGSGGAIPPATGARVRNAYGTWLSQGGSLPKGRLIPRKTPAGHPAVVKGAIRWEMAMRPIS